jgi:hypothetical protein
MTTTKERRAAKQASRAALLFELTGETMDSLVA